MFTLNDILQGNDNPENGCKIYTNSQTPIDKELTFREAHHDSRQIQPCDLFLAIKGEKVDGHHFIAQAAQAGAIGALCTEVTADDLPPNFIQIIVPDVIKALHNTARIRVQRQPETTLIAITGSNGKTSTKEAVATVLSRIAPTLKTHASYNTEVGYPLTLLRLEPQHCYAILEMGAQWVGELAWLCKIVAPHWSIITNVGSSHLEYFGSQARIALAKSELVQALSPEGIAILNYDDPNVRAMQKKSQAPILFYGTSSEADVRASGISGDSLRGRSFTLNYREEATHIQLHLPGDHGVTIALAAAAAGLAAGMPLTEIKIALESLSAYKRRGEIKTGPSGSTIIDDSYNANRQSILAIARSMHETALDTDGKRWAILGDILELGSYSRNEHMATGAELASLVDYIVAIGDQARFFVEGAIQAGMPADHAYYYAANPEHRAELEAAKRAVADLLKTEIHAHDLVLLKASFGIGLDTLLEMLNA